LSTVSFDTVSFDNEAFAHPKGEAEAGKWAREQSGKGKVKGHANRELKIAAK